MALHVGLRRAVAPAAIVGYSGCWYCRRNDNPESVAAEIKSRPPVLLVHGDQDELIPTQALFQRRKGSPTWTCRPNGICPPASATASTRKVCVTAANFWPEISPPEISPLPV